MTQDRLRQVLSQAGFQEVKIVDAAYLVQAQTKEGDSVLMLINPPSMGNMSSTSATGSAPKSTGSTAGSTTGTGSTPSGTSGTKQ